MAIARGSSWISALYEVKSKRTGVAMSAAGVTLAVGFRDQANDTEVLRLTTENGGVLIEDPAVLAFRLVMNSNDTQLLISDTYSFDVLITSLDRRRVAKGTITVEDGITS